VKKLDLSEAAFGEKRHSPDVSSDRAPLADEIEADGYTPMLESLQLDEASA
jgi:hypothetical protein